MTPKQNPCRIATVSLYFSRRANNYLKFREKLYPHRYKTGILHNDVATGAPVKMNV